MDEIHYEDLAAGQTAEFGEYEVTRDEIVRFARQYDPQPFHVDEEAAAGSMFGDLVASGWHTCAMTMRMLVDNHLSDSAVLGAFGVDKRRWPTPVRPGDTLSIRTEVLHREPNDEGRGLVRTAGDTTNHDDQVVLAMERKVLYARR
jgi:acyl dehydratase